MKSNIKAVIFDMDGVLCDSEPFICEAAMRMFTVLHGIKVCPQDFIPFVGTGENRYLGGVAQKYGITIDLVEAKNFTYDAYLEIIHGRLKPMAGVVDFIARCRERGLKLAVASSADTIKVEGNLREIGLPATEFDAIVNGLEVERRKPAPDIFQLAAKRLNLPCDRCLVVEDAPNGIMAGKAAGSRCLGLASSFSEDELRSAGAEWIAGDLALVPDDLLNEVLRLKSVSSGFKSAVITCRTPPPAPYGPVPSKRQLMWHELGMYAFVHFTINTFTDKEWGFGDESPEMFNPTAFDVNQIVGTFKDCGMKGVVLTCKHHDGFCLWPSAYTSHSVKSSPWKRGKGDMVKEFSAACRKQGLKFGVYISPWDRNHKDYGRPAYLAYYLNQLRELLMNYGDIFEVWFDGANGGNGFYGGANELRQIDNKTYYDWANTWKIVRKLQPDACMFSDAGPDVRWVGNESGVAGETCWATFSKGSVCPGSADAVVLNIGERLGTDWVPAEVDVSIRPGWFYHATEDAQVKTVEHLLKIYYESIGRGANLILNVPPDRRGLVNEIDAGNLREWKRILDATFSENLSSDAVATASNVRGRDRIFAPCNVLGGKHDRYWATDDGVTTPELIVEMGSPVTFNVVRISEYLPLGQRIGSFALDYWNNEKWEEFAAGTSIGNQRLVQSKDITTTKVRLRITEAAACPAVSVFGLFKRPG